MLTISVAWRLISAGDPAPSMTSTSWLERSSSRHDWIVGHKWAERSRHSMLRQIVAPLAEQDHLAVCVRLRLEQHGIHAHIGNAARRERLKILSAAHFPVGNDARIVAHVLRLERRHFEAAPGIPARQRRREQSSCRRRWSCRKP
jgi:hypothetical protein